MEKFREIFINGKAYEDIGYFTLFYKVIIIETTNERISILEQLKMVA